MVQALTSGHGRLPKVTPSQEEREHIECVTPPTAFRLCTELEWAQMVTVAMADGQCGAQMVALFHGKLCKGGQI